jgi:hypothetical protein
MDYQNKRFLRPALVGALESLAYSPGDTIRLDYPAKGAFPGPCLALALRPKMLRELSLLVSGIVRELHVQANDELFDAWVLDLDAMLAGIEADGAVVYFPGWTLTA